MFVKKLSPLYKNIGCFNEGLTSILTERGVGFIDESGEIVISDMFDKPSYSMTHMHYGFREGVSPYVKKQKCGLINKSGDIIVENVWDSISPVTEGLAAVKRNGKFGFINSIGEIVIPIKYDFVQLYSEGLSVVNLGEKKMCIDINNQCMFVLKQESILNYPFKENVSVYTKKTSELKIVYSMIDINGNESASKYYQYLSSFYEGLAVANCDGKTIYIDHSENEVLQSGYDRTGTFRNGFACVNKNGFFGCIDKQGKEIIPLIYENHNIYFESGYAAVMKNGKWGYIDLNNNVIIPFEYEFAQEIHNKKSIARKKGAYYLIDFNS